MAGAATLKFTDENFRTEVLENGMAVLVDFWAPWCNPCRMISPVIDELAGETTGKFAVGKMNVDESPNTAVKYGINAIPTLMVFRGGEVVQRFMGPTSKEELRKALEAAV
jgi:thioredoxin 1